MDCTFDTNDTLCTDDTYDTFVINGMINGTISGPEKHVKMQEPRRIASV